MKSLFKLMLPVVLVVVLLSCSKDSDEAIASAGSIAATVDGVSWKATVASASIANGAITIAGKDANNKGIQFGTLKSIKKGTYSVKGPNGSELPEASLSLTPAGETAYASSYYAAGQTVGTITISEIDETNKTVSGSFSGKVKRLVPAQKEIEIKGGTFNKVSYATVPTSGSNSFSVKVAGTSFSASVVSGAKAIGKIVLNFTTSDMKKIITIVTPDNVTTGMQSFGKTGATYYATYTDNSVVNESVSGSLNITSHNTTTKRIEGTFSFSAQPFPMGGSTISVTEGSFAVTYN